MRMFDKLVLGIDEDIQRNYGNLQRRLTRIPYDNYIKKLSELVEGNPADFTKKPFNKYSYVTGRVRKIPLVGDTYLMMMDCDSKADKDKSIEYLNNKKIRHFIIESSPGKFWVIGNKIRKAYLHAAELDKLNFVDNNYVVCSGLRECFVLRAFPKPGFIPKFGDTSKFSGKGKFEKWILEFKAYWETKEMENIANTIFTEAI